MNEIEKKVEKTLISIISINRAEANPLLYQQVMYRLKNTGTQSIAINTKTLWRIAACLTFFIMMNIFTVLKKQHQKVIVNQDKNAFTTEYFSYLNEI